MRRLAVLLALGSTLGCGSRSSAPTPEPQSPAVAVEQFLAAVKAKDLVTMGRLWGDKDGPVRLPDSVLIKRLTIIQIYMAHDGYRILEGPIVAPGRADAVTFRVEFQRAQCNRVQPLDLVHTRRGGWLINDVHLETAGHPASACKPGSPGTGP